MTRKEAIKIGCEYYDDGEGGCCKTDGDCSTCIFTEDCEEYRINCYAAQEIFSKQNKVPNFQPPNGICPKCGENIYKRITLDEASRTHITGCPFCYDSFCE